MNRPKMVFIVHPMSGDIEGNSQRVLEICRKIHTKDVIPVFPSFTWRRYLGDSAEDKELAQAVNEAYFRSGAVDELWVYGDYLSDGMKKEILLARELGIPVIPMSEWAKASINPGLLAASPDPLGRRIIHGD